MPESLENLGNLGNLGHDTLFSDQQTRTFEPHTHINHDNIDRTYLTFAWSFYLVSPFLFSSAAHIGTRGALT
jgi:hypothetical protein